MKSVLISIQPKWCELIASGKKTIEVRKTAPKLKTPFKCYIYETKAKYKKGTGIFAYGIELKGTAQGIGKVIGEFVCDRIDKIKCKENGAGNYWHEWDNEDFDYKDMCLSEKELENYLGLSYGYAWYISALKIYDTPKELGEFRRPCPNRSTEKIFDCVAGIKSCKYKTKELPFQCVAQITQPFQSWGYVETV